MIAEALDECATLGGFSSSDSADSPSKQSTSQAAKIRNVSTVNAWPTTGDFLLKSGRLSKRTRRNSGDFVEPSSVFSSCKKRKTETRVSNEKLAENRGVQRDTAAASKNEHCERVSTNESEKSDGNFQINTNTQLNKQPVQSIATSKANTSGNSQSQLNSVANSSGQTAQQPNANVNENKVVEKAKTPKSTWSLDEKVAFFHGIREFGRNFEALASYIAQKTAVSRSSSSRSNSKSVSSGNVSQPKTRDQVRHFYYRTWQKVANLSNQHVTSTQHRNANDVSSAHSAENGAQHPHKTTTDVSAQNLRNDFSTVAGRIESADDAATPTSWNASANATAVNASANASVVSNNANASSNTVGATSQPVANGTRRNVELASLIAYGVLKTRFAKLSILAKQKKLGDRIQELVRNGNTVIKFGGKSNRIRMPNCRALSNNNPNYTDSIETSADGAPLNKTGCQRANSSALQRSANTALRRNGGSAVRPARTAATRNECVIDTLPEEVVIELRPRSAHAFRRVQAVGHNPRLRITVSTKRSLTALTDFLNARWRVASEYDTTAPSLLGKLSEGEAEPRTNPCDGDAEASAQPNVEESVGSVLLYWPRSLLRTLRELSNRTVRIASPGASQNDLSAQTLDFSRLVTLLEAGIGSRQASHVSVLQLYLLARILNVQAIGTTSTNTSLNASAKQSDSLAGRHSQQSQRAAHPTTLNAGRSLNFSANSSLTNPQTASEEHTATTSTGANEYVVPLEFDFREDCPLRQAVVDNILLRLLQFATVEYFSFDRNSASRSARTARTSKSGTVQRQASGSAQAKSSSHTPQSRPQAQPKRTCVKSDRHVQASGEGDQPNAILNIPPVACRPASELPAATASEPTTTIEGNNMLVAIVPRRCGTSTIVQRRILPKPFAVASAVSDATGSEPVSKTAPAESACKQTAEASQSEFISRRPAESEPMVSAYDTFKQPNACSRAAPDASAALQRESNGTRQIGRQSKVAYGTRPDEPPVSSSPRRSWKKFNSWLSTTFANGAEESPAATSQSASDAAIRSKLRGDPLLTNAGQADVAVCGFTAHTDELDGANQIVERPPPATSVFDDSSVSLATFLGLRNTPKRTNTQQIKEDGTLQSKNGSYVQTPTMHCESMYACEPTKEQVTGPRPNGASASHTYMTVRDGMLVPSSSEQFDLTISSRLTRLDGSTQDAATDALSLQSMNCSSWLGHTTDSVPNGVTHQSQDARSEVDPQDDSNLQLEPSGGDVLNTPSKKRRSDLVQPRSTTLSTSELPSMLDECSTMSVGAYWETLGFGSALRAAGLSTTTTNDASTDVTKR